MLFDPPRAVLHALLVLSISAPIGLASAQTQPADNARTLEQHTFPVAEFSPTPFAFTSFGMRVGVEQLRVPNYLQLKALSLNANPKIELNSLLVAEAFDLSVRLHDRVAIAGAAYGQVRVGADRPSLLNEGMDYTYGGSLSVLVTLLRARQFQLSIRGTFGGSTGQIASIGLLFNDLSEIANRAIAQPPNQVLTQQQAAQKLQAAFNLATAEMMTPFGAWNASGSIAMAFAFNRYLGLQGSLGFAVDDSTYHVSRYEDDSRSLVKYDRAVRSLMPTGALALDFDGAPKQIPVDVLLEYQLAPTWTTTSAPGTELSQSAVEHLLSLALYYSGRKDLQLGVMGFMVLGQTPLLGDNSQPSGHPHKIAGRFVFRYFW